MIAVGGEQRRSEALRVAANHFEIVEDVVGEYQQSSEDGRIGVPRPRPDLDPALVQEASSSGMSSPANWLALWLKLARSEISEPIFSSAASTAEIDGR